MMKDKPYVGRGGEKLKFALDELSLDPAGVVAADFGCNIGGFTDCMLQEGARRVYAVDTGYGMLEWKLRCDDRVVVMERTNAMHVELPERVDVVTIDAGWTKQCHILPNALKQAKPQGMILSLFKPQYEAEPERVRGGVIDPDDFDGILTRVLRELFKEQDVRVKKIVRLPHEKKSKNPEAMLYILPRECGDAGRE